MTDLRFAVLVSATIASGMPAIADQPPGAVSCSGCHATGDRASSAIPSIYGRESSEMIATMAAFRDGSRPATVMNRIAKGFSDDELRAIAAWLATQK